MVDELPEEKSFFFHLRLRRFALADVDHRTGDADRLAVAVADDGAADFQPAPLAAAGTDPRVRCQGFRAAVLQGLVHGQAEGVLVLGVDAVEGRNEQVGRAVSATFEEFENPT